MSHRARCAVLEMRFRARALQPLRGDPEAPYRAAERRASVYAALTLPGSALPGTLGALRRFWGQEVSP